MHPGITTPASPSRETIDTLISLLFAMVTHIHERMCANSRWPLHSKWGVTKPNVGKPL